MNSRQHLKEVSNDPDQSATRRSRIHVFLTELSKRKVCRTAISYLLVMWLNLQIGDVVFPMIGAPDWALNLIVVIGIMGFPVVLILAWAFQVTAEGIMLDEGSHSEHQIHSRTDAGLNLLLLMAAIALSILMFLQVFSEGRISHLVSMEPEETSRTVVSSLSILSATEAANSRTIAAGIEAELRHRLINLTGLEVLPDLSQMTLAKNSRSLALSGSLLMEDRTAHVLAHLIDLSAGRYLMSITFNVNSESILAIEVAVAERISCEVKRTLMNGADCTEQASNPQKNIEGTSLEAEHNAFQLPGIPGSSGRARPPDSLVALNLIKGWQPKPEKSSSAEFSWSQPC